ncbi:hypothetical protein LGW02_06220 [Streptococcus mutans]|nr:hypothetical protein [Streptococcus mutans]
MKAGKNNYIEHEVKVQLMDCILENNQDYQWFVDYVENNFDLDDISSWSEFNDKFWRLRDVYLNFIKIFNLKPNSILTKTDLLADLLKISQFFIGKLNWQQCSQEVTTNFGKILVIVVFTTKLENAANNTNDEISFDLYHYKNYFQIKNLESITENKQSILKILNSINLENFDFFKENFLDNANGKGYSASESFFNHYKEYLFNIDSFGLQFIKRSDTILYQEAELLKMVTSNYETVVTANEEWSSKNLESLKEFFGNYDISNFIMETVDYIKNGRKPSISTLSRHLKLLNRAIDSQDGINVIFQSTSIKIIAKLYKDKAVKNIDKENVFIEFQKHIHSCKEIFQIEKLSSLGIPLSKDQKDILNNEYKKIDNVTCGFELNQYLEKKPGIQALNDKYLCKVANKFKEIVQADNPQDIRKDTPSLFYNYMCYLYEVHNKSVNVDKSIVNSEIMITQKVWQEYYYQQESNKLQEVRYEVEIPTEKIKDYDMEILENPLIVAYHCMKSDRKSLINFLEEASASEHTLVYLFTRMHLTPIFPIQDKGINLERHDVDKMLFEQIGEIVEKQGYRLMNKLETGQYVTALHERYKEQLTYLVTLIGSEDTLYERVKVSSPVNLISYDTNINLAHVTQLFPILEMKIRELAQYHWYLVFKLNISDFMSYKDPSSILREIIKDIYDETGSFENIPDMLFIYHFMYNNNSLNIRNECIHGRDYLSGANLRLAFRVTLLSILMLDRRIKRVDKNAKV